MTGTETITLESYDGRVREAKVGQRIATGSSGHVHLVENLDDFVVKLGHDPAGQRLDARIDAFWAAGPQWTVDHTRGLHVAWPFAKAFHPETRETIGYLMSRLVPPKHYPMDQVSDGPQNTPFRDPSWAQYLRLAGGLARSVAAVAAQGHVIADLCAQNAFVTEAGTVTLVDCDGWQIRHPRTREVIACEGSRPEVTPPEHLQQSGGGRLREPESDRWALAVVIATLLFRGTHPFAGIRSTDPPHWDEQDHVRERMCWLLGPDLRVPPGTPPAGVLPPRLFKLFEDCFGLGHDRPELRPAPERWATEIDAALADLAGCSTNPLHRYPRTVGRCPWCAAGLA